MSELGKYLKEKREQVELSQNEVGRKLKYSSAQFISNWERGISTPPVGTLKKIAALYRINSEELFGKFVEEEVGRLRRSLKNSWRGGR